MLPILCYFIQVFVILLKIVGDVGRDKVPITRCGQVQKQICAEDKCKVVEGDPECFEKTVENIVQVPEETCSLEPITECREETVRYKESNAID